MLDATINSLLTKLSTLASKEIRLFLGGNDEVESLGDELNRIRRYLQNSDFSGASEIPTVHDYVKEIRSLVHKAEDIIDLYQARTVQVQESSFYEMKFFTEWYKRYQTAGELKSIRKRLNRIFQYREDNQRETILVEQQLEEEPVLFPMRRRDPFEQIDMVGFAEEEGRLLKGLIGKSPSLEVISIVGMSGLGKTTLASKVYNDHAVVGCFHIRLWVTVSARYNPRSVLKNIFKRLTNLSDWVVDEKNDEDLIFEIQKYLSSRKYLVVLDDVWEIIAWNDLKRLFVDSLYGSRIIITTQNTGVPDIPTPPLRFLSTIESWELLSRRVMIENRTQFEKIGIRIAENCKGLPLSILVIAGILKRRVTTEWWNQVSSSVSTYIIEPKERCLEILELSFKHLPIYLKACFIYFGLYPGDFVITARVLKHLWVAEAFIQKKEMRTLEEIAEEYLEELIARNLIQIEERKSDGSIKSCSIHDLLRVFCITKAKDEEYLEVRGYVDSSASGARRLALHSKALVYINSNPSSSNLRSLLIFGSNDNRIEEKQWKFLCDGYILLHVLDFGGGVVVDSISCQVSQLICLRFLRLKSDTASELPKSICKLCFLETLEIIAPKIESPEINVWKLHRLRHVYFNGAIVLKKLPKKMLHDQHSYHHDLQTLSSISTDSCTSNLLAKLLNLVNLGIFGDLGKLKNETFTILSRLEGLKTLKLVRDLHYRSLTRLPSIEVLVNVRKLTLSGIGLTEDPMEQLKKLHSLQMLKLKNNAYAGDRLVCVEEGGFIRLEILKLISLNIEDWNVSATSMPSLRSVAVKSCPRLKDLPSSLKHISTFQELDLLRPTSSAANKAQQIKVFKEEKKETFKLRIN